MTTLREPRARITKRHRHDWAVPVGEVPRIFGLEGTATCQKCWMTVTTDDPVFTGDTKTPDRLRRMAAGYFG